MKRYFSGVIAASLFLFSPVILAHHTRDHLVLSQDPAQVIAATQAGAHADLAWLVWLGVFVALVLGLVRWWQSRKMP